MSAAQRRVTDPINLLRRRLDKLALDQLRVEAARLHEENERLRQENVELRIEWGRASDDADYWSREATNMHLQLCEARGGEPGITQDGQLVVAPKGDQG